MASYISINSSYPYIKIIDSVSVFVFVAEDLANHWPDMVLLYS